MSIATRAAFGEELLMLGEERSDIVVLDADLREATKTGAFAKKFPERAFNVGIAEQDLVATAAGFAVAGKKPFACTFAAFLTGRAYDQIRTSVALSATPVVLVGSHAGILTGGDGASHQALEDIGLMRALPNMTVLHPADAVEAKACTRFAANAKDPVYLRLGRANVALVFPEGTAFEIGKVRVVTPGSDLVVFATGPLVVNAMQAANKLADEKVSVKVVNVSCISPLDEAGVLREIEGAKLVVTAEDHSIKNGLGSAIAEVMAENALGIPLRRIGMRRFGESGETLELYHKYGFDAEGITISLRQFWDEVKS